MEKIFRLLLSTVLVIMIGAFSSCKKNEIDQTAAVITVVDENDVPIEGASVRFYQEDLENEYGVKANINETYITDSEGHATHVRKLEAILFLEITSPDKMLRTIDVVKFVQGKTVSETIMLQ